MHLARFPRRFLAHLPTPLERLDRLTKELGGPEIWIKRDDCTGMSTGGNKTRKLEFLMAEAELQGAEMIITQGATQSNHARQTAAFAAKMGMQCHIVLEDRHRRGAEHRQHRQDFKYLAERHDIEREIDPEHREEEAEQRAQRSLSDGACS